MTPLTPPPRPDRRRARTRKQLFAALTDLVLERGYEHLTIQDIADKADLSRATFYLHFADKDDLLMTGLRDIYDALVAQLPPITLDCLLPEGTPPSLPAFQQVAEFRHFYKIIMSSPSGPALGARIRDYLAGVLRAMMLASASQYVPGFSQRLAQPEMMRRFDILIEHMASSLNGLIAWWLQHDEAPYNAQDMARFYHTLNVHAWMHILELDLPANN